METPTRVKTGKVRFSYVNVFVPTSIGEGEKKYNVSVLIDKKDKATINAIEAAVEAAKVAGKNILTDKNGNYPKNLKMPLRDGDEERPDEDAYAGMLFVNASSKRQPGIIDRYKSEITIERKSEFYSGCYGRVTLTFYAFNAEGNRGIACGLNNIQKLEDGENLAGSVSAEEDFDDDYTDPLE